MPKASGIVQGTQKSTSLLIYPQTSQNWNTWLILYQNNVGAWLIQENWEEGDNFDVDAGGYHIFCHNATPGDSSWQHLFKHVVIILSPLFYKAWKAASPPPPITTDSQDNFAGRLIRLNIKLDSFDPRGRGIKGKAICMALISVYLPWDNQAMISSVWYLTPWTVPNTQTYRS